MKAKLIKFKKEYELYEGWNIEKRVKTTKVFGL
jgi:hypothetical protein